MMSRICRFMGLGLTLTGILVAGSAEIQGVTFYVDAVRGDDVRDGIRADFEDDFKPAAQNP